MERSRRRLGVVVAALAAAALPTACSDGRVVDTNGVVVLVGERADSGMAAQGGGRLEVVGGCLGAGGVVVVWPHGTTVVDEEPLTVDVPGHGRVSLGDEITLAGGYVLEHSSGSRPSSPLDVAGVTVPRACAEYDVFLSV